MRNQCEMKKAIEISELSFRYHQDGPPILQALSLLVPAGKIVGIGGPSGSGKSTLGCCIAGVIPKLVKGELTGTVTLHGKAGIIFQDPDTQIFLPTVEDEIAFGPENLCLPKEEIERRISRLLLLTGMSAHRFANPARLSGGEKQLIVIAAVLSLEPDILICDEVLASLDAAGREKIGRILLELKAAGKTVVLIGHDDAVMAFSDECWYLSDGQLCRC